MQIANSFSSWKQAGIAIALAAAPLLSAQAADIFTVNPAALGGPAVPFSANFINGQSSSLITQTGANTASGTGWIQVTGFSNNGVPVDPLDSGLNINYRLWVEYSYTAQLTSGAFGGLNSAYSITSLNYSLFGASPAFAGANFIQASLVGGVLTTPAVTVPIGDKDLIGSGSLIVGVSGLNALGGAFFNSTTSYANTLLGDAFFIAPVPFYNIAFNEFNNTSPGVAFANIGGTNYLALTQQSGGIDLQGNFVPTPSTLALVGLALIGVGAASRRKSK